MSSRILDKRCKEKYEHLSPKGGRCLKMHKPNKMRRNVFSWFRLVDNDKQYISPIIAKGNIFDGVKAKW